MNVLEQHRDAFQQFAIANYVNCPRDASSQDNEKSKLEALTLDYVRPHVCTRRLDLLVTLKTCVFDIDAAQHTTPSECLFGLKVARVYSQCMQNTCPSIESKILQLNLRIVNDFMSAQFNELKTSKTALLDLIAWQSTSSPELDSPTSTLSLTKAEAFEWLLINFSIFIEAAIYYKATRCLELACILANLELSFDGELGRRTRFQQRSLPQLFAKTSTQQSERLFKLPDVKVPKNIANKDDTVLENVHFDSADQRAATDANSLSPEQSACVLAATWLRMRADPVVELRFELIDALTNKVLEQKIGFLMTIAAFIHRSKSERLNTRRVERACQQMESLIDVLENRDEAVTIELDDQQLERRAADLFLACPSLPVWRVKQIYARVLMSLALVSDAIFVYESIQDWQHVVECYTAMNMKEKALNILEKLHIEHPDDPNYLCLIGEIRRDTTTLKEVLRITNDKYAKAHKALGMMALEAKNYQNAFDHYKRVYELTPLAVPAVYNYGVAALEIGELKDAITAFHHCVCVDPDNYRAWNNLAAAYVQTHQAARAVQVLKQGLQVHSESERMWANLFETAAELSSKRECLLAFKRFLTFNPSTVDVKPLLKIALTYTDAADSTAYAAPPRQEALSDEERQLLVECLDGAHERSTLEPIALRLLAQLHRPAVGETNTKPYERFIELMDLAESRELKQTQTPDYANLLAGLIALYDVRRRYAELTNRNVDALIKVMGYRVRPLLKRIDADQLDEDTRQRLAPLMAKASTLLSP